jgi:3-isopropylmalate/(R)-2-methylmalate dehydratase large subunit
MIVKTGKKTTSYFEYLWQKHVITEKANESLLYVDKHFVHDLSAIAFIGLDEKHLSVRRPDKTFAFTDHTVPINSSASDVTFYNFEPAKNLITALKKSAIKHGVEYFGPDSPKHGIIHVAAPDQGLVLIGESIICGDSHTCTMGALGTLAFGAGITDIEHILATQTIWTKKPNILQIELIGIPDKNTTAKDIALYIATLLNGDAGTKCALEFTGDYISSIGIEERMTLCNMAIETGAKFAVVPPDKTTFNFLHTKGVNYSNEEKLHWLSANMANTSNSSLLIIDVSNVKPMISWGTSPHQSIEINNLPILENCSSLEINASEYMDIKIQQPINEIEIDTVFIGSCTNGRLSDLKLAAEILKNQKIATNINRAVVSPGSTQIKEQAEYLGIDKVFIDAGFEWSNAGCSMCVAINGDNLPKGSRVVSTTNRNFINRQGKGVKTHLASPATAAQSAITGKITAHVSE